MVFWYVISLYVGFGARYFGISGLFGRGTLGLHRTIFLDVEIFNVGGFLTHGDFVLDTDADFVAVVEHRLVPAEAGSLGGDCSSRPQSFPSCSSLTRW